MMNMRTDPLCGMQLEETEAAAQSQYKGQAFYFCSLDCQREFDQLVEETAKAFKDADPLSKMPRSVENK